MNAVRQSTCAAAAGNGRFIGIPAIGGLAVLMNRVFSQVTMIHDQLRFARSPRIAIAQLAGDPRAALIGFRHVLYLAALWEIAVLLWAMGGATVTMPAFLKLPDDQYYFYELIFLIPMFLLCWMLASGIAYVLSKAFGGRGSFDTLLGGFGMTAAVSGYFALIPDYIQGILWTTGWLPFAEYQELTSRGFPAVLVWSYLLAYNIAYLVLYSATIHHSQNLSKSKSAIVATIAYAVSAFFFLVIVR